VVKLYDAKEVNGESYAVNAGPTHALDARGPGMGMISAVMEMSSVYGVSFSGKMFENVLNAKYASRRMVAVRI
jgi:hypothetical protein